MAIVLHGSWTQSRRLKALAQRSKEPELRRRALCIHALLQGRRVSDVARMLCAARSTVYRWIGWFERSGLSGLRRNRGGRAVRTVTPELLQTMDELLSRVPGDYGHLRSSWSSELLAEVLLTHFGLKVHPSTIRRALNRGGYVWRRARPTLYKRDPRKAEKLQAIHRAIDRADSDTEVFFVDEADIDFNPRIGFGWRVRGTQLAVPTPGQNIKHYVAGALNARTGQLVWTEHPRKNTVLFLKLLNALKRTYRRARRIVLILDNYRIHKTHAVAAWLEANPKFELLFQPVYYPWINQIERLWKAMHDTVTRNHTCSSMYELCQRVKRFFDVVQPFPGAQHGVAQFGSVI